MPNILFTAKKIKRVENREKFLSSNTLNPPLCPKSGKPMSLVICGTPTGKKLYAWVSVDHNIALPAFTSKE